MTVSASPLLLALLPLTLALSGQAGAPPQAQDQSAHATTNLTESTRAVAHGFLEQMFVIGDMRGAYDRFVDPNFIQHNPEIGDGIVAHRAFFAEKAKLAGNTGSWANVNNILLVDGDLFALHHHVFTGPNDSGRVFVDIWRVRDGRIVEHWDVIQPIPAQQAHRNGIACGKGEDYASARAIGNTLAKPTCGLPDPSSSRSASLKVIDSYAGALRKGDVRAATETWLSPDYRQHSPMIGDGVQGALDFLLAEFGKGVSAMPKMGAIRTIAEGDYVMHHRLTTYADGRETANVDIFRIAAGRISEHWDLKQPVPNEAANRNGMW